VFSKTGAAWEQVAELNGPASDEGEDFAYSVSISGVTVVVGAYSESNLVGFDAVGAGRG
jgi:hypothetical protein